MQVILGAGGAIGIELAKQLENYSDSTHLAGRNPVRLNKNNELFKCDLTKKEEVLKIVKRTKITYLTNYEGIC